MTGDVCTICAVLDSHTCHAHKQPSMRMQGEQFRAAVTFSLCVHAHMGANLRTAPAHGGGLLTRRHWVCSKYAAGEGWRRQRAASD